jgi:outer membrane murein-binding lipoprotein Lpp
MSEQMIQSFAANVLRLGNEVRELAAENARLKAEVERLTKAGDAMAEDLKACYRAEGYDPADSETIPKWNAAKEGKQP